MTYVGRSGNKLNFLDEEGNPFSVEATEEELSKVLRIERKGGLGSQRGSFSFRPINWKEALEPSRRYTPAEIERRMGGEGYWITPSGQERRVPVTPERGIETHATTAIEATGRKPGPGAAKEATEDLLGQNWIRVRGPSVEASFEAMNTEGFQKAVLRAAESARQRGTNAVIIEVYPHADSRSVPLAAIGEFLKAPSRYMRRTPVGLPMSRLAPPLPPEAVPPRLREPAYA
jgi:hypothetical protein